MNNDVLLCKYMHITTQKQQKKLKELEHYMPKFILIIIIHVKNIMLRLTRSFKSKCDIFPKTTGSKNRLIVLAKERKIYTFLG